MDLLGDADALITHGPAAMAVFEHAPLLTEADMDTGSAVCGADTDLPESAAEDAAYAADVLAQHAAARADVLAARGSRAGRSLPRPPQHSPSAAPARQSQQVQRRGDIPMPPSFLPRTTPRSPEQHAANGAQPMPPAQTKLLLQGAVRTLDMVSTALTRDVKNMLIGVITGDPVPQPGAPSAPPDQPTTASLALSAELARIFEARPEHGIHIALPQRDGPELPLYPGSLRVGLDSCSGINLVSRSAAQRIRGLTAAADHLTSAARVSGVGGAPLMASEGVELRVAFPGRPPELVTFSLVDSRGSWDVLIGMPLLRKLPGFGLRYDDARGEEVVLSYAPSPHTETVLGAAAPPGARLGPLALPRDG